LGGLEGGAGEGEGEVAGLVDGGSGGWGVVGGVAEFGEEALGGEVGGNDGNEQLFQAQAAEGEGMQHHRKTGAEALALLRTLADEDGEFSGLGGDVAKVCVAKQLAVELEQEGFAACAPERFEMFDDLVGRHDDGVGHHGSVVVVVVVACQRRREASNFLARGLIGTQPIVLRLPFHDQAGFKLHRV